MLTWREEAIETEVAEVERESSWEKRSENSSWAEAGEKGIVAAAAADDRLGRDQEGARSSLEEEEEGRMSEEEREEGVREKVGDRSCRALER